MINPIQSGVIQKSVSDSLPDRVNSLAEKQEIQNVRELHTAQLQGEKIPLGEERLIKAVERALKAAEGPYITCEYSIHKATNDVMVKVINKDTGEIIREIPPEKVLDRLVSMLETAGIIVDKKI